MTRLNSSFSNLSTASSPLEAVTSLMGTSESVLSAMAIESLSSSMKRTFAFGASASSLVAASTFAASPPAP